MLVLLPIRKTWEENKEFVDRPDCAEVLGPTIDYYKVIGYHPPWIGYLVKSGSEFVGSAGYKGSPVENKIEIAYGTFPAWQHKGIGTAICAELVALAKKTDPSVIITARTLPDNNHSTRILEKNGFRLLGTVWDKDDGNVWEWLFEQKTPAQ